MCNVDQVTFTRSLHISHSTRVAETIASLPCVSSLANPLDAESRCLVPLLILLELELIQTQMAQKPMLRAEVYARALRASQKRETGRMYGWARDAPDEWAGRGRVREWKALAWGWRDL